MTASSIDQLGSFAWIARSDTGTAEPEPPSLIRLTRVELRKMVDTRAGFWLLLVTVLGALAVTSLQLQLSAPEDIAFAAFFDGLSTPAMIVLPILGVLTVTGEWSHRTALTTFTLVPQRLRIVAAKVGAGTALAVAGWLVCLLAAALATLLGTALGKGPGDWHVPLGLVLVTLVWQIVSVVTGVAFGMLLISAVLAIGAMFMLPMAWAVAVMLRESLTGIGLWLNPDAGFEALAADPTAISLWVKAFTGALLWVGLPLFLGSVRLLRREIK